VIASKTVRVGAFSMVELHDLSVRILPSFLISPCFARQQQRITSCSNHCLVATRPAIRNLETDLPDYQPDAA
jgi:hypothetical protein